MQKFVLDLLDAITSDSTEYTMKKIVVCCQLDKDAIYLHRVTVSYRFQHEGYFRLFLCYLRKYAPRRNISRIIITNIICPWLPEKLVQYGFTIVDHYGCSAVLNLGE